MNQPGDDWRAIHEVGHRNFVGGNDGYWESISALQFEFLKANGLRPSHTFFDIGCGSLRAGTKLIDYLDPDRYVGVDKHIELVIYGVAVELGVGLFSAKHPRFVISDRFEFDRVAARPDIAIAQSLFSHLNSEDILTCLTKLKTVAAPGCRFFATFFESQPAIEWQNPNRSHSHGHFRYSRAEMEAFGVSTGWFPHYISEWDHPRDQRIIEFSEAKSGSLPGEDPGAPKAPKIMALPSGIEPLSPP